MFPQIINTPRAILRPPNDQDIKYWIWDQNPEVKRYLPEPHDVYTDTDQIDFFNEIKDEIDGWYWSIEDKETGTLIGILSVTQINDYHGTGEIGIIIGNTDYYRQGFATEIIKELLAYLRNTNIKRLTAECEQDNIAMCRVFEKAGFELEAICKSSRVKDEKRINTRRYSILI
jgi:[ribosomal protein S5]-alanine N-acetyltransferase